MPYRQFLASFHLGAASGWDLFIILVFLITVLVYGLFLGRNRLIVLLLSSYFSFLIVNVLPWERLASLGWLGIGDGPSASLEIIIFLGIILLFYFLIPRSVLSSVLRIRKRGDASWLRLLILSVVQVGLLAMTILSFLPKEALADIGSIVKMVFVGSSAQFVWTILPILTVVLMRRNKKIDEK
ncbi:MAG: hypothetical protein COY10_00530 [Candidatus Portnoybacteria bacterium CG_4_10_14_0_2_um_filter_43_36]|uniref:Uncharacterized protein n=3 Tax=Candidatus Portnoyibacteriota TaxID=1817913 RepID=A0A2M7YLT2_9BACT|nr:MAG: hypothetical protein COX45_02010 [Candidatus Portnoybacteria bacterium CG23_combo_of_CG06-09_8_20_14_all_44_36]PIZ69962.1 MAG: hypothetical protein COY10_00530 [Candidatus Portnoybacteria bacterium CG_4_10_14_0_2_um_filter_43_36]PJA63941.1 MAG: hypothetical protein CO160_01235 [Candidatus Portnoybacteria bacterium CG_4_9_14_3_um_filter_43_11]PJE59346.1 MAG: hypothetical protein COU84_01370 [Candidatus Portnoybacteria bacterium CG10_big_fil_rev_8_21_14_0_10_43_39]